MPNININQVVRVIKKIIAFIKKKKAQQQNQNQGYQQQQQSQPWQQQQQQQGGYHSGGQQAQGVAHGPFKPQGQGGSHIGPHHPQNQDQINASNQNYVNLRNQAIQEGNLMKQCFDNGHNAYESHDGARAKQLSNEGHEHQRKRDQLNKQAADWIFRENNRDSPHGTVDLHGLFVQEAIEKTEEAVQNARGQGLQELRLIVGKGIHSDHHVQKLKPAVEELMQRQNLSAHLDPHNAGVLVVNMTGGGSRDLGFLDQASRQNQDCIIV